MTTCTVSRSGLVLALGAGFGMAIVQVSDGDIARTYGWLQPITSFSKSDIGPRTIPQAAALTATEMVAKFRDEGIPIATIAEISGVERKTVYAWLSGGAVRSHNQDRLEQLYLALSTGQEAEFRHLYRFWNRNIVNGPSLGELLRRPELDLAAIEDVLTRVWPLAKKQQQLVLSRSATSSSKTNPFVRDSREVGLSYGV